MTDKLTLNAHAGDVEALLDHPTDTPTAIALVCHPHPLFQGTMHNKVAYMLARAFTDQGALALRFNFRGVGHSAGEHNDGRGETDDAVMLAQWLRHEQPDLPLWLGGFSFGAMVAFEACAKLQPNRLVTVAPAAQKITRTAAPECPWLFVQGDADDVVDPIYGLDWARGFAPPPAIRVVEQGGHFFHGQLTRLRRDVREWLAESHG